MSVLTTTNRVDYTADGSTFTFSYAFAVYTQTDLKVYVTPAGGVNGLKVLNVDYTQTAVNVPGGQVGGSVTFMVTPNLNDRVTLIRTVPITQATSFTNLDKFDAKTSIEGTYDKAVMILQQLYELVTGRSFVLPVNVVGYGTTLPDPTIAANQGLFLQIGASGITAALPAVINITVPSLTAGSIPYASGATAFTQDNANLFWDSANKRLGVGTNAPTKDLDVSGAIAAEQVNLHGIATPQILLTPSVGTTHSALVYQSGDIFNIADNGRGNIVLIDLSAADGALTIDATGQVGVNIYQPNTAAQLHVKGHVIFQQDETSATPGQLLIRGDSNTNQQLIIGYNTTSDFAGIQAVKQAGNFEELRLNPAGGTVNASFGNFKVQVVATGSLPAAGASMNGTILIEDAGAGDRNIIIYAGGERFRIDGGAAF